MDLEPTDDQVALQEGVRNLCRGRFPMEAVRAGLDRGRWQELADAGVFSLRVPEGSGGVGLGMADAALVFEELGRALVPGPLVATHLAAGVVDGDVVGVVERGHAVAHLDDLDALAVLDHDRVAVVDVAEVRDRAVSVGRPVDPLTPLWRAELPGGEQVGDGELARRWRVEGAVLTGALLAGIASATTELAVAYAKERQQFDRPIGSFQAVKHICADMLVRAELARAAVDAAGATVDQPDVGDPERAARAAKLVAGESAIANGKACIQVHGGMGFTWEVDAHLYLKRAWVLEPTFGAADELALAMAGYL